MKIFFNEAFVETNRETSDLWVKYNNGVTLDAYFKGLNIKDPSITARLVLRWNGREQATHELPLSKAFDGTHFTFTMPILEESGPVEITIRIYKNGTLTQPVIFTREIKESLDPSDADIIKPEEWQSILHRLEVNEQAILDRVATANTLGTVYATAKEPDEFGNVTNINIKYSVEPTPKEQSVVIRSDKGRAEFEDPEGEKDAVNKRTYDKVVRATTLNHAGLLFVSPLNEATGKVTVIYNSSLVRHISDVNPETGTIRITARPINWDCTPKPQEGGNN